MKECKNGKVYRHLENAINYINDPEKTDNLKYTGTVNCITNRPLEDMLETKRILGKQDGRQGYHMVLSFAHGEVNPELASEITQRFINEYLNNFEVAWAVHNDKEHIHGHIIFNSVSFENEKKYHYKKGDWKSIIQPIVNQLCEEYDLSTIDLGQLEDNVKTNNLSYNRWEANKEGKAIWSDIIRYDIDVAISESDTYTSFLNRMKEKGYKIREGTYLTLTHKEKKKGIRSYRLGKGYSVSDIKYRIEYRDYIPKYRFFKASINKIQGNQRKYRIFGSKGGLTKERKEFIKRLYKKGKTRRLKNTEYANKESLEQFYKMREVLNYIQNHNIRYSSQVEERKKQIEIEKNKLLTDRKYYYRQEKTKEREYQLYIIRKQLLEIKQEEKILENIKQNYSSRKETLDGKERERNYTR